MAGLTLLRRYLQDAVRAVELAPVEFILAFATAATFSYAVELDGDAFRAWGEVAVVCALGAAAAWVGTLLYHIGQWTQRTRWAVTAAGMIAAGAYGLLVVDFHQAAEGWRAGALVSCAALVILSVPVFAPAAGRDAVTRFRRLDLRFLLRGLGAAAYGAALFAGLALALGAVESLFELDLDEGIYLHVFGFIAFALVPWIVVGGIRELTRPLEPARDAHPGLQRFAAYLLIPLLIVYYGILCAYALRIAITGEVPSNLVSPLVLAAGGLLALAVIAFEPLLRPRPTGPTATGLMTTGPTAMGPTPTDQTATGPTTDPTGTGITTDETGTGITTDETGSGLATDETGTGPTTTGAAATNGDGQPGALVAWPIRLALPLFLPLGALGFWAVMLRVAQYGWTEFRYLRMALLVVLILLAAGGTVQAFRRRRLRVQAVPILLAAILLVSAVGPWSAPVVSRQSQTERLLGGLRAARLLEGADVVVDRSALPTAAGRRVPAQVYQTIRSTARYLTGHFGAQAVVRFLPVEGVPAEPRHDLAARLGLIPGPGAEPPPFIFAELWQGVTLPGSAAARVYPVALQRPVDARTGAGPATDRGLRVALGPDSTTLRMSAGADVLIASTDPLVTWLLEGRDQAGMPRPAPAARLGRPRPARPGSWRLPRPLPPERALLEVVDAAGQPRGRLVVFEIGVQLGEGPPRITQLRGVMLVTEPPGA